MMYRLTPILLAYFISYSSCLADVSQDLMEIVTKARGTKVASRVDGRHLKAAETLFRESHRGTLPFADLKSRWEELDFELLDVTVQEDDPIWVIREQANRQSGRGVYAVRPRCHSRLVVQAPHGSFDRHTREIAVHLAADSRVAAIAWNTVHRSKVDVAHVEWHFFNAFTRAVTANLDEVLVVQLHGFSKKNRTSVAGQNADFIVSNGSHLPSSSTIRAVRGLQKAFPDEVIRLYPWEVRELGATTNIQGDIVRGANDEFLSVEIAAAPRQQLLQLPHIRTEFLKALLNATESGY